MKKAYSSLRYHSYRVSYAAQEKTDFIFNINSFKELTDKIDCESLTWLEEQIAIWRWYKYMLSCIYENEFVNSGAKKATEDEQKQHIDFWINGTPFDLKLTVLPKQFNNKIPSKDELIKKLYTGQGVARQGWNGRIFIVCCGKNDEAKYSLQHNVDLICSHIKEYMNTIKNNNFYIPEIEILPNNGGKIIVQSDVIFIK